MNGWYLSGIVVWKGKKRAERAPWPCMIETDGGTRDCPTVQVPVDVFGDVEVGQRVELTGFLDCREWQGRHYLQLSTKTRKVEWPGATPPPRQPDPPPPPRQECRLCNSPTAGRNGNTRHRRKHRNRHSKKNTTRTEIFRFNRNSKDKTS